MTPQQIESSAAFGKDRGRIKEAISGCAGSVSSSGLPGDLLIHVHDKLNLVVVHPLALLPNNLPRLSASGLSPWNQANRVKVVIRQIDLVLLRVDLRQVDGCPESQRGPSLRVVQTSLQRKHITCR